MGVGSAPKPRMICVTAGVTKMRLISLFKRSITGCGLPAGDRWCLCVLRWKEAFEAGVAPKVILESTHQKALQFVTLEQLQT